MYHSSNSCCQYMAWARPHLLLFLDYPLVESLDPTTRIVTHLGSLSGMVVSPTGRWFAGTGSAGPEDPIATTVYVLAVGARKCLVVPGTRLGEDAWLDERYGADGHNREEREDRCPDPLQWERRREGAGAGPRGQWIGWRVVPCVVI